MTSPPTVPTTSEFKVAAVVSTQVPAPVKVKSSLSAKSVPCAILRGLPDEQSIETGAACATLTFDTSTDSITNATVIARNRANM